MFLSSQPRLCSSTSRVRLSRSASITDLTEVLLQKPVRSYDAASGLLSYKSPQALGTGRFLLVHVAATMRCLSLLVLYSSMGGSLQLQFYLLVGACYSSTNDWMACVRVLNDSL